MANYIKPDNGLRFRLQDYNTRDKYSIWDNNNNKFLRENTNPTMTGTSGKTYPFEETKYIRKEEFETEFPGLRKVSKISRDILTLDGTEAILDLPKTLNDRLTETMTLLQQTQQNPLSQTYEVIKTGSGLNTKYGLKIVTDQNQQPVAQPTPQPNPEQKQEAVIPQPTTQVQPQPTVQVQPTQQPQLKPIETDLLNKIKSMGIKPTFEQFQQMCAANQITDNNTINAMYHTLQ